MNKRALAVPHYQLMRHEKDETFHSLATSIAEIFNVPIVIISIMDEHNQIVKGAAGFSAKNIPKKDTLCNQVVVNEEPFVIENAAEDQCFENNPYVQGEPKIRGYAGVPITFKKNIIGALCLVDPKPRKWKATEIKQLEALSVHVTGCLELMSEAILAEQEHSLLNNSPAVLMRFDMSALMELSFISENASYLFNLDTESLRNKSIRFERLIHEEDLKEFLFTINNHKHGVLNGDCRFRLVSEKKVHLVQMISSAVLDENDRLVAIQIMLLDNTQSQYLEQRLLETNERMRLLLEASELGTWDWDIQKDVNRINQRWCDMLGLNIDDVDNSSAFWRNLVHPADQKKLEQELERHLSGKTDAFNTVYRMRHRDGHWIWIETFGRIVAYNENGEPYRLAGTHRDISDKKEAELKDNKQRQLLSFINNVQTIFLARQNIKEACSDIFTELLELANSDFGFIGQVCQHENKDALLIHAITDISWSDESEKFIEAYNRGELYFSSFDNLFGHVISSGKPVISNAPAQHHAARGLPEGHPPLFRFMGVPITYNQKVRGMIGFANKLDNYTEQNAEFLQPLLDTLGSLYYALELNEARLEAEQQLKALAETDSLTQLSNRRAFIEQLENFYSNKSSSFCLAIADIDYFKKVNDTYGHHAGDKVLMSVAKMLKNQLRTDDVISRLGGEEFGIIMHTDNKKEALETLNKLCLFISKQSIEIDEIEVNVTVSIGATLRRVGSSYDDDMQNADSALYKAKNAGRNQVKWFRSKSE